MNKQRLSVIIIYIKSHLKTHRPQNYKIITMLSGRRQINLQFTYFVCMCTYLL